MDSPSGDFLTPAQREAVEHFEGPLMVLAGPGSGKTRVITCRIARLLERGVHPENILALTFTNKASREMQERVERLLGGVRVRVSTFHKFCSRLIRRFADHVGLKQNFTILDQSDQISLVRQIMKDLNLDTVFHDPGRVLARISRSRNELITATRFREIFESKPGSALDAIVYQVFPVYEQKVRQQNAADFDDLLLHVVNLLEDEPLIREQLDEHFRFILVDEYQDTNHAQYRIVQAMSQNYSNLCATGDPDQSIYGWRGARPANITAFERDFPNVRIVSLDQNFRSTKRIVECAETLISHNRRPHRGRFITDNPAGDPVRIAMYEDAEDEASGIASEITQLVKLGKRRYSDFAVFYRVNALSRPLETAFARAQIPYQIAAGYSFFERAEVRDLIAYLRLIENQSDDAALERIINRPARGIGNSTILRLRSYAELHRISIFDAAREVRSISDLSGRSRKAVDRFVDLIEKLHEQSAAGRVAPLIERLIAEIDYMSLWREESDEVDVDRAANVFELISAARQYDDTCEAGQRDSSSDTLVPDFMLDAERPSLQGFLELATLSNEADSVDSSRGSITLMTMHAAKGLEFPAVYIIGLENGLIPHERAVRDGDPSSFEEERRLLFVGITRAMQDLTLTQTSERVFRGQRRTTITSPFLMELRDSVHRESVRSDVIPISRPDLDERILAARQRFESAQKRSDRRLVMTAAELAAQQAVPDANATDDSTPLFVFQPGMLVRHPRYGRGVVTQLSGGSHRATVSVQFETSGEVQTFVAARCPLQPIGFMDSEGE
ncbi:MAG: ATP-dependent helicase [Planctomycetota bacterium]